MVQFEGGTLGSTSSGHQSEILPWYPPAEAEVLLPASEMGKWLSLAAVSREAGTTCLVFPHIPTPARGQDELGRIHPGGKDSG